MADLNYLDEQIEKGVVIGETAELHLNQKKKKKKTVDPKKKRNRKINQILILVVLGLSLITVIALVINIVRVVSNGSKTSGGTVEAMGDTGTKITNDLYEIGNNPTDAEKKYFESLTTALNSGTDSEIIEAVVNCFVSDYFTWTNKDGNYEVGGLQYVYPDKLRDLDSYSRYNFYGDLDLYISQYGRSNLLQVKEITTDVGPVKIDDFELTAWDEPLTFTAYTIHVNWTYESTKLDVDAFPQGAYFIVIDDNGRWEIAEFYTDNEIDYIDSETTE